MLDTDDIRTRLTDRLAASTARIGYLEGELERPLGENLDEQAIEIEDMPALDALEVAVLEEMRQTREALRRLDAGTYGICQDCGAPISDHRLAVLPAATLCIECAIANVH